MLIPKSMNMYRLVSLNESPRLEFDGNSITFEAEETSSPETLTKKVLAFSILKHAKGEMDASLHHHDFANQVLNRIHSEKDSWAISAEDIEEFLRFKASNGAKELGMTMRVPVNIPRIVADPNYHS